MKWIQINLKKHTPTLLSYLFALLLLIIFYGEYLFHPGTYLFSGSADGVKGYYTYAWQTNYGQSPFVFTGMNYPFGENTLFTDGHTSVSLLLWFLPFLKHYPVETLNLLMLAGIVVTAGVICALLIEWGANRAFAIFGAVIITFLSPMMMRICGHFSLSYGFVIPLGMLWWTRLLKTGAYLKYSSRIALLVLIMCFTHAYSSMMLASLIFLSACSHVVFNRNETKKIKFWMGAMAATILPVVVFMVIVKLTDSHTDRPETPTGFFQNFAAWKGVFLPVSGYFREWVLTMIDLTVVDWEKWAYLGTGTLFAFVLAVFLLFFPARISAIENRKPISFMVFMIPAVLLLIFASGFPFRLYPRSADWVAFIKQFRVMARFAWPFYFVAGIYAVLFVQHIWNKERIKAIFKYGLITAVIILSALDIITYQQTIKGWMGKNKNIFHRSQLSEATNGMIDAVKKENPAFLLVFPYFHVGSEIYVRSGTDRSRQTAFTVSYHTAKPMLNVEMSRTSVSETERLFDLFVPKYALKKENENLMRGKVVLIDTKEETTFREKEILKHCKLILSGEEADIYTADAGQLFKNEPFYHANNKRRIAMNSSGKKGSIDVVYYSRIEQNEPLWEYITLDKFKPWALQKDSIYHLSFHIKTRNGSRLNGLLIVETVDKKGEQEWVEVVGLSKGGMSYRGKTIFENSFVVRYPEKQYGIYIKDGLSNNDQYIIDNYLFRRDSYDVYVDQDSLINNYPVLSK